MNMYLRHMMVFARVVETGSISAAALDLDISKSVVSQQLKALEVELGVTLLKRTTRQQTLTPVGREFFQQCQKISDITQQAWQDVRDSQIEPKGSITISAPHALIDKIIAPAIGSMVNRYPGITPTILANDHRVQLVETKTDLAIRVGNMPPSDYRQRLIGQFHEVLCASPEYIQQERLSATQLIKDPDRLLTCDYVANIWEGKNISHKLRHKSTNEIVELSFRASRFNDSINSVVSMVRHGAGIALVPDFLFYSFQNTSELQAIFPNHTKSPVPVYAVHAYGKTPTLNMKLCIDFIKGQMQKSG